MYLVFQQPDDGFNVGVQDFGHHVIFDFSELARVVQARVVESNVQPAVDDDRERHHFLTILFLLGQERKGKKARSDD